MKKTFLVLFLFSVVFTNFSLAQYNHSSHSTNKFTTPDWDDYDFDMYIWTGDSRPMIELNYGFGDAKRKDYDDLFSKTGLMELKLGYSTIDSWDGDVLDFRDNFVFGSRLSDRVLSSPDINGKITQDSWRFGFGDRGGYGYKTGMFAFLPYHSSSFTWTMVKITDPYYRAILDEDKDSFNDPTVNMLNRYDGTFRFGEYNEGGLNIQMGSMLSIGTGYEFAVVYPRHLFWKHLGSFIIDKAGQGAITFFVEEIMDNSPAAGPIVNLLLKTGFSYALYSLRKDQMNWPFPSETPLTYETVKFNLSFTF